MSDSRLTDHLRLYLVAGTADAPNGLLETVEAALLGGVTAVQLREKSSTDLETLRLAERLRELCNEHDATLFLNDRVDIALAAGADGVHLGVDDLPIPVARRLSNDQFVIGFSPDTDTGARSAKFEGASYLGVGPVFGTASKSDAGPAIGISILKRRGFVAELPVIGIGGIDATNAASVIRAGAAGVAVMSAILRAEDPKAAAAELRSAVDGALR
jgi:thiamine-phosphate diphosphorylase